VFVLAALFVALLLPTTAWAQADYTGTPPPDKGSTLTNDAGPNDAGSTGGGAEVKGRQFAREASSGNGSTLTLSDLLVGLPFLLVVFGLLFFWLRRRRDEEEEDEDFFGDGVPGTA
jgi:hypothetical protein